MFHAVPTLWRLHRVHHADLDFDVTTGIRFHPVEILLSTLVKCAAVAAIGAPAVAVLVFEVHRVHHSTLYDESSSNFGFNLPWWDRLFGTYRAQPRLGHDAMAIGVGAFRSAEDLRLDQLLIQPLRSTPGQYPITRRQQAAAPASRLSPSRQ